MSIRKRIKNADYLMIGENYEFCGTGFTKLDDDPAASTSEKRYINMKSSVQSINGYAWTAPLEFDQIESEKAIAFITKIGKQELIGDETETNYVSVDLDGTKDSSSASKGYPARMRKVAIEVASFDDSDGDIQGSGNLLAAGDWVLGWFDIETKAFTEDDSAADSFSYAVALA